MSVLGRTKRAGVIAGFAFAGYAAYARNATLRFENLDPHSDDAPGTFLNIDGDLIHYVEAGRGLPVVLVHGWNGSTFSFRYVISELARQYRVIAIDLLGFGYSARPANGDYSLSAQAKLVSVVLDRLDVEHATLLGHSMGGAVAMRVAVGNPDQVERLVLADSVTVSQVRRAVRFSWLFRLLMPLAAPFTMHRERFRRRVFRSAVHDPAFLTPEMLAGHYRPLHMRGHLQSLAKQLIDRGRDDLWLPDRIGQPTLILWGEHDRWIPLAAGEAMAEQIPDARLVVVPSAGHMPLEEQPEFCNRELLKFLPAVAEATAAEKSETPA
ncbi:MAG: alpha/beta hydrolase [Chloroflexi bacterium]|nr:alpha/beta hydrolase [Chloroflexota bacterium]